MPSTALWSGTYSRKHQIRSRFLRRSRTRMYLSLENHQEHPSRPCHETAEKHETSLDITQRLEKRLARYNASKNIFKQWLFEIISWTISAACMGAIVGILLLVGDRSLSKAGFLAINVTNILSKVASAGLIIPTSEALGQLKWNWFYSNPRAVWDFEIFDKASRGPWGSAMLLFRTKGRSLAALGAALTLLLLGTDSFFQQVVDLPQHWCLFGNGSMPTIIRYQPHPQPQRVGVEVSKDPTFEATTSSFFYGNGTQPILNGKGAQAEIPLSCPSNNCTWAPYETLGFCSVCTDISQLLTFTCAETNMTWLQKSTVSTSSVETACGYFLNATSEAPVLMSGYVVRNQSQGGEVLLVRTLPLITVPKRKPLFGGSINFKEFRNPVFDVLIVSAPNGTRSVYRNETPIARECAMTWCVKKMRSTYFEGTYEESVMNTSINTTTGPYPWRTTEISTPAGNFTTLNYLQDIEFETNISERNISTRYKVSNTTAANTIRLFDEIFPSYYAVSNATEKPRLITYTRGCSRTLISRYLEFNPWLFPNNIPRHLDRLAVAMTNDIRSSSSRENVKGDAFLIETYIKVDYRWLGFPFTLLVLTLGFLIATIIKTSKVEEIGIWKTSTMPSLIYGLPEGTQEKAATPGTWSSRPRTEARKMKIRFLPNQGWRFSGQPRLPSNHVPRSD